MSFVLPSTNNDHNTDPDSGNPRFLAAINAPTLVRTKTAGNLPITELGGEFHGNTAGQIKGLSFEFQASQASWDVSSQTKVLVY